MLWLSALFIAASLFWIATNLVSRYQTKLLVVENEWEENVRYGLSEQFLFVNPTALRKSLLCMAAVGGLVSFVTLSPWPFFGSLLLAIGIPILLLRHIRNRRQTLFQKQFGLVLPQLSAILHAGHTFDRAIESLIRTQPAPLSQEFQIVAKELRLGTTMEEAMKNLCLRYPSRDLELVSSAVSISRRVGSNLSEAFDRVAEMIRARAALRDRLTALTAQGKVQAMVAIAMPILLTVGMNFLAPDYLSPLFRTSAGHLAIAVSIVLLSVGGTWVYKISKMELIR